MRGWETGGKWGAPPGNLGSARDFVALQSPLEPRGRSGLALRSPRFWPSLGQAAIPLVPGLHGTSTGRGGGVVRILAGRWDPSVARGTPNRDGRCWAAIEKRQSHSPAETPAVVVPVAGSSLAGRERERIPRPVQRHVGFQILSTTKHAKHAKRRG